MTLYEHKGRLFSIAPPPPPEPELWQWSLVSPSDYWPRGFRTFRWRLTRWWYFWQWPGFLYARIRWWRVTRKIKELESQ